MKTLWIKVSRDPYEFILAVADTPAELAQICGVTKNTIISSMSHAKEDGRWCQYQKIEIDEEEKE